MNHRALPMAIVPNRNRFNRDARVVHSISTSSIAHRSGETSRDRRIRSAMVAPTTANNQTNQKTEMLQKARAALPLTKIREKAFEGAFFSVALIAMAGWVYFITLLLVRLFLWFFS
ncbi:hypothetical protein [Bradyrhizobium sacchari]|nr:hypothetical protein [Bradyrhizobium sacchari]